MSRMKHFSLSTSAIASSGRCIPKLASQPNGTAPNLLHKLTGDHWRELRAEVLDYERREAERNAEQAVAAREWTENLVTDRAAELLAHGQADSRSSSIAQARADVTYWRKRNAGVTK